MNFKSPTNRLALKLSSLGIAVLMFSIAFQSMAFSNPVEDKKQKAARIAKEIDANGSRIAALSEEYNKIRFQLDNLKTSVESAKKQLESAKIQNDEVKARVQKRAVTLYSSSSRKESNIEGEVDNKRRTQYAEIATGNDASTIRQLEITTETVNERKAELEKQLEKISADEKALAEKKKTIEDANKAQEALLKQTRGELATLVAQQRARNERPRTTPSSAGKNTSNQTLPGNLPAPSPKAAIAIEYARAQLGKPYKYAASGPNSFDCSGLTMRAYEAAGIKLPHYSGAQYAMFPKVAQSQFQPGDLVFRGPGGSQHVGLYIGNGLMIHAPQTGDVVKISPVRSTIGGSRPG